MIGRFTSFKAFLLCRLGILFLLSAFWVSSSGVWEVAQAQTIIDLPAPGVMVPTSLAFEPLQLKGILVNVKNPLRFDFLVDKGDSGLLGQPLKDEITRLAKYFLTCLAVPENDLWVNLSPYEKDRIVPDNFGITLMGKDLLEQDYLLKQIMASLSYPENDLGKRFWQKVYRKSYELYGTTEIPINTFNKVWILPKSAEVYVQGNSAFVVNSQLDVMLEADYKALVHHSQGFSQNAGAYSQILRDVILPELRQEVNTGKNFAVVRQVYNAMILATWYKRHLRDSLLGKLYVGRNQVKGVDIADKNAKEEIFQQYLKAYKKCVYNYIKEDYDTATMQTVPRKYASGGMYFSGFGGSGSVYKENSSPDGMRVGSDLAMATVNVAATNGDGQIISFPDMRAEVGNTHPFHFEKISASSNQAMLVGMHKFLNKWTVGIMFAVAIGAVSPTVLQAETFSPGENGTVIMHVETGDQLGKAMEKIRLTYKALSPEEYKKSPYAGSLYTALGRVTNVMDNHVFQKGDQVQFTQPIPQNVLEALSTPIAQAVQSHIVVPAEKKAPAPTLKESTINNPEAFYTSLGQGASVTESQPVAQSSTMQSNTLNNDVKTPQEYYQKLSEDKNPPVVLSETQATQSVGAGSPPPPDDAENFWLKVKIGLGLIVLLGVVGYRNGYTLSGLMRKSQKSAAGTPPATIPSSVSLPSLKSSALLDVGQPKTPPASPGEATILEQSLAGLRALASQSVSNIPPSNEDGLTDFSPSASAADDAMVVPPEEDFPMRAGLFGSATLVGLITYWVGMGLFLAPVILMATHLLKGNYDFGNVLLGCGIIVYSKRIPMEGVTKKYIKSKVAWFFKNMETLKKRGGQSAGVSMYLSSVIKRLLHIVKKIINQKRDWKIWQTWDHGPVFYRNMIQDLHKRFYDALPSKIIPVDNHTGIGEFTITGQVRFATNGKLKVTAAHPHFSPMKKVTQWVYDSVEKAYKKVKWFVQVTSGFNGDNDGSYMGIVFRGELFSRLMGFAEMRSFFSAVVHSYYNGRVTKSYLKSTVSNGNEYRQKVWTNYGAVLRALRKKGYVNYFGKVNRRFIGLDDEFKSWFPQYKEAVFNEIESALFGMPSGDAPINPLELDLFRTQGRWDASVRYAHTMINHHDLQEARRDILFEDEERAVGEVFSEVFDQVEPFITRRGYTPEDPETVRSLSDLYVKDEYTARQLGLLGQYEMLEFFRDMLDDKMQEEAKKQTLAGDIFRQWEQKWKSQGLNVAHMRRLIINTAVEKFFTADSIAAVKEFAERSEGTFGIFMRCPDEGGTTYYQNGQDVVLAYNEEEGEYEIASDPRILKSIGPTGKKFEYWMPLKDQEVINVSFSPSGKIVIKSWIRIDGQWRESTRAELKKRLYPIAEYYDDHGVKKRNPYYAPPPFEYASERTIVQEDLRNIPNILAKAQVELDDPDSLNAQSTEYLSERMADIIQRKGRVRIRGIAYGNSFDLTGHLKKLMGDLIDDEKVIVDPIDATEFNKYPSRFKLQPDDIVLIISKSGATGETKLSMRVVQKYAELGKLDQENIFCMTARPDSVLLPMMGQGLHPQDPFTKRVFILGEFYDSETPVASEILLTFQLQQLAINLTRALEYRNDVQNSFGLEFSEDRMEYLARKITDDSITMSQKLTGFDTNGNEYANADKEIRDMGTYLGKAALETWKINRLMDPVVAGILIPSIPLFGYFGWLIHGVLGALGSGVGLIAAVFLINYYFRYQLTELYRKMIHRPDNGRIAPFKLFIVSPQGVANTQSNFFRRLFTNSLSSISPSITLGADSSRNLNNDFAPSMARGDIVLHLARNDDEGVLGLRQATYPETSIMGTSIGQGEIEDINYVLDVPRENGATKEEIKLKDRTVGILGLMIAAKAIGVRMADIASFGGRLFKLSETFSGTAVHTTLINSMSDEVKDLLYPKMERMTVGNVQAVSVDEAMSSLDLNNVQKPGGISMNSRLMQLKITGDIQNRSGNEDNVFITPVIRGLVPQVSGIITVTPGMLKAMLGE